MQNFKPLPSLIFLAVTTLALAACAPTSNWIQPIVTTTTNSPASTGQANVIELAIWASGSPEGHWRIDGPLKAVTQVTEFKLKVTGRYFSELGEKQQQFVAAAQLGQAPPDIIEASSEEIRTWAEAGYLMPFDFCRSKYPQFDDVIDRAWEVGIWHNHTWGVPFEFRPASLFFNKSKLKEIGWSDEDIAALPGKIKRGEFTQDDLLTTAQTAVAQGVVEPGFGYWYRPAMDRYLIQPYLAYGGRTYDAADNKLVINREALLQWYTFQRRLITAGVTPDHLFDSEWQGTIGRGIYYDTIAYGRVLFWSGQTSFWTTWAEQYAANLGGDAYLDDFVGYALYPSARRGQPGLTDSGVSFYTITSPQASGRRQQEAACALLAKTITPEINSLHPISDKALGILKSQVNYPDYKQYPILVETRYMLEYARYLPHSLANSYRQALLKFMLEAENGRLTPAEAAVAAIDQLRRELRDEIIVEDR